MNVKKAILAALVTFVCVSIQAQSLRFNPDKESEVKLSWDGLSLNIDVKSNGNHKVSDFAFETDKKLHIALDDFNFDGVGDFAVWHTDDGMGTYRIFRVFIYDVKTIAFTEIFPSCGDEFINLVTDKKNRSLNSTYYEDNIPKQCVTSF
ncbi:MULTISPECIES: XAC2610-related protein [Pseudomonas]|uniref:XAC2610-related protein n=1 Tax=Pseudomonas TaxID=286 RepID=UPI0005FC55A7|nr:MULTISPECIES: hypothetical protein [Pseudomonas]BAQ76586.1 uncharacterized protein POS17_4892 [Pseudomonas sp. Os17]BAQ82782.1 uncharacterized protein PST29_4893 [Pseudomonas sp. St29]